MKNTPAGSIWSNERACVQVASSLSALKGFLQLKASALKRYNYLQDTVEEVELRVVWNAVTILWTATLLRQNCQVSRTAIQGVCEKDNQAAHQEEEDQESKTAGRRGRSREYCQCKCSFYRRLTPRSKKDRPSSRSREHFLRNELLWDRFHDSVKDHLPKETQADTPWRVERAK